MISLQNVSIGYDKDNIFTTISHDFLPGKISVIIGGNGVGKSTLIKMMTRQMIPLSGQILLRGKKIDEYAAMDFAQCVAYLPQHPSAPLDITVKQLCLAGRFPYKRKWKNYTRKDIRIIEETLHLLGLDLYIDTPLAQLSGGLRQRAWFAMILVQETDIIILDEPTSFLDIAYQLELLELLSDLNKTLNKTIIMILHDMNHAMRYADQIIALRKYNTPLIESPEAIDGQFLERVLQIKTHIARDPIIDKKYAVPLANTISKKSLK